MKLSNKAYDAAKFVAQVALPAVGTLYFAMAQIWHLPKAEEIVGTVTAVDTFLGIVLGISTTKYNQTTGAPDGDLIISADPVSGEKYLGLGVNRSVEAMTHKEQVKLNVVDNTGEIPPPSAPPTIPSV